MFTLSSHLLNSIIEIVIQNLVFADHVSEQLLSVFALETIAPGTHHRLLLAQLSNHLVSEVLHGQVIHPLPGLVLGLWLEPTQFTHPAVGVRIEEVGGLSSDRFSCLLFSRFRFW